MCSSLARPIWSTELYNPQSNTWSLAAPMTVGRTLHTATLLEGGKVLAAGGLGFAGPLASTELYDPQANSWSISGTMNTARYGQTSTLLPNGEVLGMCGGGPVGGNPTAEIYDPVTASWRPTLGTENPRADSHTATLLLNGQVLVTGGQAANDVLSSTEVFKPPPALAQRAVVAQPLPAWLKVAGLAFLALILLGGIAALAVRRLSRSRRSI